MPASILRGGCHCGALSVELATSLAIEEMQVRACQCTFCRIHSALSASDPQGSLTYSVADGEALSRYRFSLRLADYLVCRRCGAYLGTFMAEDGATQGLGVLNINVLEARTRFRAPQAISYDAETAEQRVARRRERWMPTRLRLPPASR